MFTFLQFCWFLVRGASFMFVLQIVFLILGVEVFYGTLDATIEAKHDVVVLLMGVSILSGFGLFFVQPLNNWATVWNFRAHIMGIIAMMLFVIGVLPLLLRSSDTWLIVLLILFGIGVAWMTIEIFVAIIRRFWSWRSKIEA